jgi:hypothetical protein
VNILRNSIKIGQIKAIPRGYVWSAFNRSSKKVFQDLESCQSAAKKALGKNINFQ